MRRNILPKKRINIHTFGRGAMAHIRLISVRDQNPASYRQNNKRHKNLIPLVIINRFTTPSFKLSFLEPPFKAKGKSKGTAKPPKHPLSISHPDPLDIPKKNLKIFFPHCTVSQRALVLLNRLE